MRSRHSAQVKQPDSAGSVSTSLIRPVRTCGWKRRGVTGGPTHRNPRPGRRTLDLGRKIAEELFSHRAWSAFDRDDDLVLPNPRTGRPLDPARISELMAEARHRAGITDYVRPSHDLRHTSLTNAARAGASDVALMARAGHSSFATTKLYISLAGARFQDEADRLESRLWGSTGTNNRYNNEAQGVEATPQTPGNPS
jgi:integrase